MSGSEEYALDTSFLIYHYFKKNGKTSRVLACGVLNPVTISEVFYVLCREKGLKEATVFLEDILKKAKTLTMGHGNMPAPFLKSIQ